MGSFCIAKGAQPSALWWPRRVGGKLEREGICTHLRLIHAVVGQKPTQHCKAIILQLEVDFLKRPSAFVFSFFFFLCISLGLKSTPTWMLLNPCGFWPLSVSSALTHCPVGSLACLPWDHPGWGHTLSACLVSPPTSHPLPTWSQSQCHLP